MKVFLLGPNSHALNGCSKRFVDLTDPGPLIPELRLELFGSHSQQTFGGQRVLCLLRWSMPTINLSLISPSILIIE
jgi:hypothetical protein